MFEVFFFVSYVLQHDSHLRDVFYAFFSLSVGGRKLDFLVQTKQHSGLNITNSLQIISQFCALDSPLSLSQRFICSILSVYTEFVVVLQSTYHLCLF